MWLSNSKKASLPQLYMPYCQRTDQILLNAVQSGYLHSPVGNCSQGIEPVENSDAYRLCNRFQFAVSSDNVGIFFRQVDCQGKEDGGCDKDCSRDYPYHHRLLSPCDNMTVGKTVVKFTRLPLITYIDQE